MKKLNIAMVCDPVTDYTAGSFISTIRFAESLKKRGHKIIFIIAKSPKNKDLESFKNIKIYKFISFLLPKSEKSFYLALPRISKIKAILLDEKIDIVHIMIPTVSGIVAVKAAKALDKKIIIHSHTQPENIFLHLSNTYIIKKLNKIFYDYLIWLYKQADTIIYPTKFAKKLFPTIKEAKTAIISNGVDTTIFKKTNPEPFIKKYKIPATNKNILFVGRLHPEKDIETLISALTLVIKEYQKVNLIIVGFGHLEEKLKQMVKDLNLEKFVTFTGMVSDKDLVLAYNSGDMFVLPSMAELEGMAVLEAMSCSNPVIIANSESSASTAFVKDNGFLFKPKDSEDLASKILYLLKNDDIRKEMGKKSLEISNKYSIESSVTELEKIYYKLTSTNE